MPRKRYTQKGLDSARREAQERHRRLENQRVERLRDELGIDTVDPLDAAAALTSQSIEFAAADLIVGAEMMLADAAFDEATGESRR